MWLMVMFDLPVTTKENRRDYRRSLDKLEDDGYIRVQFSIYVRPCATDENTEVHMNRVIGWLPPAGEVRILKFTDKQWARMTVYFECERIGVEAPPEQLLFFDEDLVPLVDGDALEADHRVLVGLAESASDVPPAEVPARKRAYVSERSRTYGSKGRKLKKGASENPSFDFFD